MLLLDLEIKFILMLLEVLDIVLPLPEQLIESVELTGQQSDFIFQFRDDIFVASPFHHLNLIPLASLFVIVNVSITIIEHFS